MVSKAKIFVWSFLILIFLGYGNVWGENHFQNLLGLHAGTTTGAGLFYRHYMGTNFACQVSFFPTYQQVSSYNQEKKLFISLGNMEQWFLHFTQLNTSAMNGMLFVWAGGSFVYQYLFSPAETENNEFYQFSLGGGPGFELIFYEHVITTLAIGYAMAQKIPGGFMMNFAIEFSCGYKF
ncbi:MAG: hypothetical protein ACK4HQ_06850 [Brevinematales bacterium]